MEDPHSEEACNQEFPETSGFRRFGQEFRAWEAFSAVNKTMATYTETFRTTNVKNGRSCEVLHRIVFPHSQITSRRMQVGVGHFQVQKPRNSLRDPGLVRHPSGSR